INTDRRNSCPDSAPLPRRRRKEAVEIARCAHRRALAVAAIYVSSRIWRAIGWQSFHPTVRAEAGKPVSISTLNNERNPNMKTKLTLVLTLTAMTVALAINA